MYSFNRRFRPREVGGVPLLSVMALVICGFLGAVFFTYEIALVRLIAAVFFVGLFLIGTLNFIFKDDLLFTESFVANHNDVNTPFLGGDQE